MSLTDNDSQDSVSLDGTYFLVNGGDPTTKREEGFRSLLQEVLQESHSERAATPTERELVLDKVDQIIQNSVTIRGGSYLFKNVFYLGTSVIQKPNDAQEVNRCIADFSKQNRVHCSVSLSVPFVNNDSVKMFDGESETILAEYPICKIGFCTSGYKSQFGEYLAFSFLQSEKAVNTSSSEVYTDSSNLLQCQVFKMKSPYYTDRILECFRKSFDSRSNNMANLPGTIRSYAKTINVQFKMTLDIKEDDGKGNFVSVPKEDNQVFKMRCNIKKKIVIKLEQINGPLNLCIERCMGLFIGAGRHLSDVDMNLLEMDSLGEISDKSDGFVISGEWNPCDKGFELLNSTRDKDQQVYMTVGISFCVQEIEEPLCLKIVCKAKIFSEFQRFWLNLKKSTIMHLMISLEEMSLFELNQILVGKYITKTIQYIWPDNVVTINCNTSGNDQIMTESMDSDNEEPMKSGGGVVSKEITDEQLMSRWASILTQWQSDAQTRPKELNELVKLGIPEALRGEVWQLMASSVHKETELQEVYKIFITKETKFDSVIKRDMPRTFTAHPLFLQKDGPGQESLFRVCKAYALYDEEIGYCQSSAFLAAALIIHMPEEQAFTLLVAIMNNYKVREMYINSFEGLHICLYQLDNLMTEKFNDLHLHFSELQLESHMYANQWFMTLFTMKFHLCAVFHILDLFLSEGIVIIFKVSLALLKLSRKELLTMDFEGALNYFRITLPKLYRNEQACRELISTALNIKISNSKLSRLEKEWRKIQEVRAETEDPLEILQKELKKNKEEYNRLDQENDALAKELITSKVSLQRTIDKLEENLEVVTKELFTTRKDLVDAVDERNHLQAELKMVKDKFRDEVQVREDRLKQQDGIIMEYKKIATQLSDRAEKAECRSVPETDQRIVEHLKSIIVKCEQCKDQALDTDFPDEESHDTERDDEIICMTRADYWHQKEQVHETELLLANTKLSLVESHCAQQKLIHEVTALRSMVIEQRDALEASKVSIMKKFWNLRDKPSEPRTVDIHSRSSHESRHSLCQPDSQEKVAIPRMFQSISQDFS